MNPIRRIRAWLQAERMRNWTPKRPLPATPVPSAADPIDVFGQLAGERLRLATEIADEAARCEIESYCAVLTLGTRQWYDTEALDVTPPEFRAGVARALRYLDLRSRVQRHPQHPHIVRFPR